MTVNSFGRPARRAATVVSKIRARASAHPGETPGALALLPESHNCGGAATTYISAASLAPTATVVTSVSTASPLPGAIQRHDQRHRSRAAYFGSVALLPGTAFRAKQE